MGEVFLAYPQAAAGGIVPDRRELLARHPGLAEELQYLLPCGDPTLDC